MVTKNVFKKVKGQSQVDPCEAANIHAAYHLLKSYRAVERMMNRDHKTIRLIMKKYNENPAMHRRPGSGRPRKTTPKHDRLIVRCMKRDRSITGDQIKRDLRLNHVSERLIRRRLSESGEFASYWKTKAPYISKANRLHRVKWCKARLNWSLEQWKKVLWSDESPFVLRFNRKTRVWRTHNERYTPIATVGTVKSDTKLMVWGCFAAHGVGRLYRIHGIMDGEMYRKILDVEMWKSSRTLFARRPWIFQQDNDPKHTARATKEWFQDHNIPLLSWPAQSPDLNPIENLWSILDLRMKNRKPGNLDQLFETLQEAWNNLPVDLLNKLVESMPRRCQAVIDAKGPLPN